MLHNTSRAKFVYMRVILIPILWLAPAITPQFREHARELTVASNSPACAGRGELANQRAAVHDIVVRAVCCLPFANVWHWVMFLNCSAKCRLCPPLWIVEGTPFSQLFYHYIKIETLLLNSINLNFCFFHIELISFWNNRSLSESEMSDSES